eukprot:Colp12_sorted_trinity150504_noHs@2167
MRIFAFLRSNEPELMSLVNTFCKYKQTPMSIHQLAEFGKNITQETPLQSCKFLRNEIPIRLAHMVKEIDALPIDLVQTPSVKKVRSWYMTSFKELINFPSVSEMQNSPQYVDKFTDLLEGVRQRHASVVTTMARGIMEMKEHMGSKGAKDHSVDSTLQSFLDRFYMSRIGIRMLIAQHVELFSKNKPPGSIGVIDPHCDVSAIVNDAAQSAKFLCDQYYFSSPDVKLIMPQQEGKEDHPTVTFMYVPSHLYHIMFEILKNSMRAVVEHHGPDCIEYPAIKCVVVEGEKDVTIKVRDLAFDCETRIVVH